MKHKLRSFILCPPIDNSLLFLYPLSFKSISHCGSITCNSLLILVIPFLFHLHHFSLNPSVVNVTEVLCVLLHSFSDRVCHHRCEATLVLLKVFMIFHLKCHEFILWNHEGGSFPLPRVPTSPREFPTHCWDVALGLSHSSHLRGVQDIGSFALYLFPEAIGIKNLPEEKKRMSTGPWYCPHSEASNPLQQVGVEGAGREAWVRKDPARPMNNMEQVSVRMGGQGSHPGGSVLTLKM